jgi:hypothetical protein
MTEQGWLDLDDVVTKMLHQPQIEPAELAVWGGSFTADRLEGFLQVWAFPRQGMLWSLWQWTDEIAIQFDAVQPDGLGFLERGRVFGPDGDLEIRRDPHPDGDRFLWRFIGAPETPKPAGFEPDSYWDGQQEKRLRAYERTALLWGSRDAARKLGLEGWHEDRVGGAQLNYPHLTGNRVQLRYVEYLDGSNVELVRFLGLVDGPEEQKGGDHA